ncbi:phosphate ABC transporter substrate-binding protein [Bacterioplanes sanyensis]|uniref:Phosphate ABC transporter substrate-binding protein n=1 Tax=Bacterioplanes sanyensis TaxID=1249553 RepID=A0A222FJW5_9GAMM|nr:phosphate ABC transporter substrate-binding protein [Bacterioplanes sanyensis]ASP38876.1 phosphate ABC transporter substrate-binding protein [Bacterioplanes sanyensis]
MKTISIKQVLALTFALLASQAQAEFAVIVSASNQHDNLDKTAITRIFLGKASSFPDGSKAIPVDQTEGTAGREAFNSKVLEKSPSQLKAYWSRLIFTGKGTPPQESGGDSEVKGLVANNPNLIGYIDASMVDDSVKVVYRIQ